MAGLRLAMNLGSDEACLDGQGLGILSPSHCSPTTHLHGGPGKHGAEKREMRLQGYIASASI
jgi:hypothetical protein